MKIGGDCCVFQKIEPVPECSYSDAAFAEFASRLPTPVTKNNFLGGGSIS